MPTLGDNIRAARLRAGIATQLEFAEKLKVAQPQLSDWENDRYDEIKLPTLLKIAGAIPCSLDELVIGISPEYDASRDQVRQTVEGESAPNPLAPGATDDAPAIDSLGLLEERDELRKSLEEIVAIAARHLREDDSADRRQSSRASKDKAGPRGRRRDHRQKSA